MDLVEIVATGQTTGLPGDGLRQVQVRKSRKSAQAARKKQKQIQVKEIKFRPGTEIGDYNVKLRNLTRFLTEGDKVKVTLRFRGREMAHQELGRESAEAGRDGSGRTGDGRAVSARWKAGRW